MTTSERSAFVWVWLPGAIEPVVAGKLVVQGDRLLFVYGRSYLARAEAIPLYLPELPLQSGPITPLPGLRMAGCLRDAAPDAWGRRVILYRQLGAAARDADTERLDELAYLLASDSDRVGALDVQASATNYVPRDPTSASLEALAEASSRIDQGLALPAALQAALQHGTSLGGARPKAGLTDGQTKWIAKFSSSTDRFSVVKAEFVAMRLAALAGLDVAPVRLTQAFGKDVLLVERFDRRWTPAGWQRRAVVSALTLLGLEAMMARYASYADLAEQIRQRFTDPAATLQEVFARLVFNILCGNTDDHARNHAAFWDGTRLSLTPAFDLCPQARTGREASQAMAIVGEQRLSQIALCLQAAATFGLTRDEAEAVVARQVETIEAYWESVCDTAQLPVGERALLWRRQFLNPFAFGE